MTIYKLPTLDAGNKVPTAKLGSGVASSSVFLRGDQTWAILVPTQSSVQVYRDTAIQSIPPLTYTLVNWTGEEWDTDNEFNLDTDRYAAATAGKRLIICDLHWESAVNGKSYQTCLYLNGNLTKLVDRKIYGTDAFTTGITGIVNMAVNDYIEIFVYHNANNNQELSYNKAMVSLSIQKIL